MTSFPILCFVPIFNFVHSPRSFLVLVTVGRHYDVRGVFFGGRARNSEKKRERLSTGLGYDPHNTQRSSFGFSKVKVLEGTPHRMKNSV